MAAPWDDVAIAVKTRLDAAAIQSITFSRERVPNPALDSLTAGTPVGYLYVAEVTKQWLSREQVHVRVAIEVRVVTVMKKDATTADIDTQLEIGHTVARQFETDAKKALTEYTAESCILENPPIHRIYESEQVHDHEAYDQMIRLEFLTVIKD